MLRAAAATAGLLLLFVWQLSGRLTTDVQLRGVPPVSRPAVTSLPEAAEHTPLHFAWSVPIVENRAVLSHRQINACLRDRRGWIVVGAVAADSVRTRVSLGSCPNAESNPTAIIDSEPVGRTDLCQPGVGRPTAVLTTPIPTTAGLCPAVARQEQSPKTVDQIQPASDRQRVDLREFWLPTRVGQSDSSRNGAFRSVLVRRCATAGNVGLFWDVALPRSQSQQAACDLMAIELAERVIPAITQLVGPIADIDGDGEFTVVISSGVRWVDRDVPAISASTSMSNSSSGTPLFGYTRVADFLPGVATPHGNGCDVMYLTPELLDAPQRTAVLIHEATHAACFSARCDDALRLAAEGGVARAVVEEDWLCEAIAHCAEKRLDASHSNIAARESLYLQSTNACPLVVPDFSESGLWRHPGCRGAGAKFLESVVAGSGPGLLRLLASSRYTGLANLEHATGRRFEDLVAAWGVEMARSADKTHPRELARCPLSDNAPSEFVLAGTSLGFIRWSGNPREIKTDPALKMRVVQQIDSVERRNDTQMTHDRMTIEWFPESGMIPLLLIVAEDANENGRGPGEQLPETPSLLK